MKFSYKPSPNYRNTQSTSGIMLDLTLCLLAVLLFAAVYYGVAFGASYGLRVVGMTAASTATALLTECAYFKFRKSKNIKKDILHSYGWVTALILTCITRIDVSYYSLIIATFICIIAGKLVFGGFGQNIFNPAAFGEALIMLYLSANASAKVTADVFTSATPMAAMNSQGWMIADLGGFLKAYGGFGGLMVGSYPSVIGGSCALVILLCFAFLLWRKDIDWHLSVTYLITVFCLSLIVGLIKGTGISYALFNVISGGVLFGTVFMMTDPVTTPITIPGRMIFAVGCAALTLILRWRANLPDGVLFSILLMNMLTPAIDKLVDGNQIKNQKLIRNKVMIASAVFLIVALAVGKEGDLREHPRQQAGPLSRRDGNGHPVEVGGGVGGAFHVRDGPLKFRARRLDLHVHPVPGMDLGHQSLRHRGGDLPVGGGLNGGHGAARGGEAVLEGVQGDHRAGDGRGNISLAVHPFREASNWFRVLWEFCSDRVYCSRALFWLATRLLMDSWALSIPDFTLSTAISAFCTPIFALSTAIPALSTSSWEAAPMARRAWVSARFFSAMASWALAWSNWELASSSWGLVFSNWSLACWICWDSREDWS